MKRFLTLALLLTGMAQAAPIDDLVIAAELNDPRAVTTLLRRGIDPNLLDDRGRMALFMAVREESLKALDALLLAPNVLVDKPNTNDETALMIAAIRGSLPAVKALVQRGASVNREGWTPLHYAASGPDNGVAGFLVSQGAKIDARSPNGSTPLMMAARYGSTDVVPVLLKAGADPSLTNEQGLTAADFAQRGGRERVAADLAKLVRKP